MRKIHSIDQNYSSTNKSTIVKTVLASVNRKNELEKVFIENRPQIVFHAAAYKLPYSRNSSMDRS